MEKHYLVYTSHLSMKPDSAHEIFDVMCANAAKNIGYSSVCAYPDYTDSKSWFSPATPQAPTQAFKDFYDVDEGLKILPLPVPKLLEKSKNRLFNSYRFIYQYYLPFQVLPKTDIVHTRDWSCAKLAVKKKVNVIFEKHYFQEKALEPEFTNSPYLKLAVTQSDLIKKSLIESGMPENKVVALHNGFSQSFLVRNPEASQEWRNKLLKNNRQHLVVYSGALYSFKGIDILIDAAKLLPEIQFAATGGTPEQVESYRQSAREKQVDNIDFLGWILPTSSLIDLLQAADILAHPHCSGRSASFTNPIKFFQYIAVGVPIVATEIEPLMEFKTSPIVGAWCEPDDPAKFAEAIQTVLQKYPRKVEGYVENLTFAQQYTWEARIEKIRQLANL